MLVPYLMTLLFTVFVSWNIHHHDTKQLQQQKNQIHVLKQRLSKRPSLKKIPKKMFYDLKVANLQKDADHE